MYGARMHDGSAKLDYIHATCELIIKTDHKGYHKHLSHELIIITHLLQLSLGTNCLSAAKRPNTFVQI